MLGIIIHDRSVHPLISLISRSVRYKYNALYIHAPKNYLLPFWCAEYPVRVIAILAYAIQFYGILPVHGQVLLCKEWTPNTLSVTNTKNVTYNNTVKQYVVPAINKQPYSTNTCIYTRTVLPYWSDQWTWWWSVLSSHVVLEGSLVRQGLWGQPALPALLRDTAVKTPKI